MLMWGCEWKGVINMVKVGMEKVNFDIIKI